MFIQTEQTPNPATLKFLPGREVTGNGTADFDNPAAAERSPLAQRLFAVDGIEGVFLGNDFISITKGEEKEWYLMKPAILGIIMEHFTAGRPVLLEADAGADVEVAEADQEVVEQIRELLDTRVRPAVAQTKKVGASFPGLGERSPPMGTPLEYPLKAGFRPLKSAAVNSHPPKKRTIIRLPVDP